MDKATIEVWVTTLLALAMQHVEQKTFWLGRPRSDPPDMALMTISENGRFLARELEVTRCTHPDDQLIINILKKDREHKLSDKYILCCLVEIPGVYDLAAICLSLHTQLKNIKNIVLVFCGVNLSHPDGSTHITITDNLWTVVQVSPVFESITLNLSSEYDAWLQDRDKLRYTKNGAIWRGKKNPEDTYPTLLGDTPLSI